MRQVDYFKYLSARKNVEEIGKHQNKNRIAQARRIIGCLDSIWIRYNETETFLNRIKNT
jgi:hypothetical protein